LHGLGLYIYAGEDLPEEPQREEPSVLLNNCKTQNELKEVFLSLNSIEQKNNVTLKDELKLKLK
jgi:hypothetical protein